MDVSMWVLIGMLTTAMALAFWKGGWRMILSGFKEGALTFKSIWVRLVLGFSLGGLIQVVIPSPVIAEWLGPASGMKGILIGSYAGIIITGGPYVTLPVVASIFTAGAGVGPVIALLTSMNLISLPGLLTWAIPFMGVRLALSRYIVCLVIPPIVGLAGSVVYEFLTVG
jgi:uncharacterized membrane protein YraQ (UPF0718 family)